MGTQKMYLPSDLLMNAISIEYPSELWKVYFTVGRAHAAGAIKALSSSIEPLLQ
jgi:hypothetical protein